MKRRDDGIDVQGKAPGFWYYPQDFERDCQILSLAAQGLWLRMMGWMHFNQANRGFLELATGEPMNQADIAAKAGKTLEEVERCIGEMRRIGLFSEDERGCIFCRRMVKDTAITKQRAAAAKKRAQEADRTGAGTFAPAKHPAKNDGVGILVDAPLDSVVDGYRSQPHQQNTVPSDSVSSSVSSKEFSLHTPHRSDESDTHHNAGVTPITASNFLPGAAGDDGFMEFRAACIEYGMGCSEAEWREGEQFEWKPLGFDQKLAAVKGIRDRIEAGDKSLVNVVPKNYLKRRLWDRNIQRREPRQQATGTGTPDLSGPAAIMAKMQARRAAGGAQ